MCHGANSILCSEVIQEISGWNSIRIWGTGSDLRMWNFGSSSWHFRSSSWSSSSWNFDWNFRSSIWNFGWNFRSGLPDNQKCWCMLFLFYYRCKDGFFKQLHLSHSPRDFLISECLARTWSNRDLISYQLDPRAHRIRVHSGQMIWVLKSYIN